MPWCGSSSKSDGCACMAFFHCVQSSATNRRPKLCCKTSCVARLSSCGTRWLLAKATESITGRLSRPAPGAGAGPGLQGLQTGRAELGVTDRVAAVIDEFQRHVGIGLVVQHLDTLARVREALAQQVVVQARPMTRHVAQQHANAGVVRIEHVLRTGTRCASTVGRVLRRLPPHDQLLGREKRFVQPLDRHLGIAEVEAAAALAAEHTQTGRRRCSSVLPLTRALVTKNENSIHRLAVGQLDHFASTGLNPYPYPVFRSPRLLRRPPPRLP